MSLHQTSIPRWTQVVDDVVERAIEGDLTEILAIVAHGDTAADAELARRYRMCAKQGANECRFARTVRTDQTDRIAAHERRVEVADEHALANLNARVLADYNTIAAALGDLEPNGHRSLFTNRA